MRNSHKFFLLFVAATVLTAVIYGHGLMPEPHVMQEERDEAQSRPRIEIIDLQYESATNGQKKLFIKADRFSIQKKKVGFFRIGLMNMGVLENAEFKVHLGVDELHEDVKPEGLNNVPQVDNFEGSARTSGRQPAMDSGGILPPFVLGRVTSVVAEPVVLSFLDEERLVTRISSDLAVIRATRSGVKFSGSVEVVSGEKKLTAKSLIFYPDKLYIEPKGKFELVCPGQTIRQEGAALDIYLDFIDVRSE